MPEKTTNSDYQKNSKCLGCGKPGQWGGMHPVRHNGGFEFVDGLYCDDCNNTWWLFIKNGEIYNNPLVTNA